MSNYDEFSQDPFEDFNKSFRGTLARHYRWFIAEGIILVLLGIAAIVWPYFSSIAVASFIGALFLLSGISGLAIMFWVPVSTGFIWPFISSALALFTGVILLMNPEAGIVSLTFVLITLFTVEGIFQIIGAISNRGLMPSSWGWLLISGLIDIALAWVIFAGLPASATWTLGLIAGLNLISTGAAILRVAFVGKSILK